MKYEVIGHKVIEKNNKTLYLLQLMNANPTDGTKGCKVTTAFVSHEYVTKQGYDADTLNYADCTLKRARRTDGTYYDRCLLDKNGKE